MRSWVRDRTYTSVTILLSVALVACVTLVGCSTDTLSPEQLRLLEAEARARGARVKVVTVKHNPFHMTSTDAIILYVVIGLCLIAISALGMSYWHARVEALKIAGDANRQRREEVEQALSRLRDRMTLPSLIELNRSMLNEYHSIATNQAQKSFRSGQRAIFAGFTWLIACFTSVIVISSFEGKIITAALAPIGGLLAGFLGRTYIHVYERSLSQLNQYYNQPLLNSYYLTAERLAENISDSAKDRVLECIVDQMLATASQLGAVAISPHRSDRKLQVFETDDSSSSVAPDIQHTDHGGSGQSEAARQ